MAVAAKDIPITRDMVYGWLQEYNLLEDAPNVEHYIAAKVNDLDLVDSMVDTREHENLADQTSVVQMILDDLPSYGPFE